MDSTLLVVIFKHQTFSIPSACTKYICYFNIIYAQNQFFTLEQITILTSPTVNSTHHARAAETLPTMYILHVFPTTEVISAWIGCWNASACVKRPRVRAAAFFLHANKNPPSHHSLWKAAQREREGPPPLPVQSGGWYPRLIARAETQRTQRTRGPCREIDSCACAWCMYQSSKYDLIITITDEWRNNRGGRDSNEVLRRLMYSEPISRMTGAHTQYTLSASRRRTATHTFCPAKDLLASAERRDLRWKVEIGRFAPHR
jgi:hypothetical protein